MGVMKEGQVHAEPSKILDELYAGRQSEQAKLTEDKGQGLAASRDGSTQILLTTEMVDDVVKEYELGEQAGADLRRAIHQMEARLKADSSSS
jgi:hypothetical protein